MFEIEANNLLRAYFTLIKRIEKGEETIKNLHEQSGEAHDNYVKQLNYLKGAAFRASACIDILNGDVILIGEQSGSLVIAKRRDEKAKELIGKTEKLGGSVTKIDILERA